jgi:hypothetical protein
MALVFVAFSITRQRQLLTELTPRATGRVGDVPGEGFVGARLSAFETAARRPWDSHRGRSCIGSACSSAAEVTWRDGVNRINVYGDITPDDGLELELPETIRLPAGRARSMSSRPAEARGRSDRVESRRSAGGATRLLSARARCTRVGRRENGNRAMSSPRPTLVWSI